MADIDNGMGFLLTWNPNKYAPKNLDSYIETFNREGRVKMQWRTGHRQNMPMGSTVYLMRLGVDPKGIVGHGRVISGVESIEQKSSSKSSKNRTVNSVNVEWDYLAKMPIIPHEKLVGKSGDVRVWSPQASGTKIPSVHKSTINDLWQEFDIKRNAEQMLGFAKTLSDMDHENDYIDIGADVTAISTLLAVNQISPPLSIAIFGDWGSGKTFLMDRVRKRVQLLENFASKQTEEIKNENSKNNKDPAYCSSILQIEFNAWHYTESNLWASLVNHIFEKIHDKLSTDKTNGKIATKEDVDKLFEKFATARAATEEIQSKLEAAKFERKKASAKLSSAKAKAKKEGENLAKAMARSALQEVEKGFQESTHKENVKSAYKFLGMSYPEESEHTLDDMQSIYDTARRFNSSSEMARELVGSLLTTKQGQYGAIVVIIAIIIITIFSVYLKSSIIQIGSSVAVILAWLATHAHKVSPHLKKMHGALSWMSAEKRKQETAITEEISTAQNALTIAQQKVAELQKHLSLTYDKEVMLEAGLKDISAQVQMKRFVEGRVTSGSYTKHLGLISTVRRDFEALSDFMLEQQTDAQVYLVEKLTDEFVEKFPKIDRIILYVDDLDRCSPERVTEVLEAIHLLLAFKLFAVVIAVDPRWVIESLRIRYPHLSESARLQQVDASDPTDGFQNRMDATAHDYLEKIFNLPFWVKKMSNEAKRSLLAGYINIEDNVVNIEDDIHEENLNPILDPFPNVLTAEPSASLKSVGVTKKESRFINDIAIYLGDSPRRIKRFSNSYSLLKARMSYTEREGFISNLEFKSALALLALITGAPSIAPKLINELYGSANHYSKLESLREKIRPSDNSVQENDSIQESIKTAPVFPIETDKAEINNAVGIIDLMINSSRPKNEINKWILQIIRYAFRPTPLNNTVNTEGKLIVS